MSPNLIILFIFSSFRIVLGNSGFIYNGFQNTVLDRDGIAEIKTNGLLLLTNGTKQEKGHVFNQKPFLFKNTPNGSAVSFSTTFVFAIVSKYPELSGHGIVFVIAPSKSLPGAIANHYLGLFNETTNGKSSNHVIAVELDTIISSTEFGDINDNHVGIDINDLRSVISAPTSYFLDDSPRDHKNLTLVSGKRMQVWIEYDGLHKLLNVTIAPFHLPKPKSPLLSLHRDISPILLDSMYVGFSSATGSVPTLHCILGWSFQINGTAQELDLSRLPRLPRIGPKKQSKVLTIGLPIIICVLLLSFIFATIHLIRRKRKFAEEIEDWELSYGGLRRSYKELYVATKGFKENELLGVGGFGRVYRGVVGTSKTEVAVKRISHESRQGIREFIAEIASMGQLRHRNLVQLLGYCRRKGELLLVYDYMPNGSLDQFLFSPLGSTLSWNQRFRIIKGVASGLLYLHEEWEQVVIHRDIKASNVLIDGDFNARLGDFGLARLYDHGTNPQTTHVVGTLGYLAPEMSRSGKATTSTDVFGFGAFLLEVACGRRPIEPRATDENLILADWVITCWSKGNIFETTDPKLGSNYVKDEMELVLKLGLLCSHSIATSRPSMRQIVQFLDKDVSLVGLADLLM
ncbi:L-type lectin-domain containing receptor kinase IV.1 [Ranunculus cassubicifolius]